MFLNPSVSFLETGESMSCLGPSCRQLLVPIAQQKPLALARGFLVPSRCPCSATDVLHFVASTLTND